MIVKQVRQGRLLQQRLQVFPRRIAIAQACVKVHDPGPRPARAATATRQSPFQCDPRGLGEFGRSAGRDLVAGMQREQVRDVAMAGLPLFVILLPFLKLAVLADFQRRQLRFGLFNAQAERGVGAEQGCGLAHAPKQCPGNFQIHHRTHGQGRRPPVTGNILVFRGN